MKNAILAVLVLAAVSIPAVAISSPDDNPYDADACDQRNSEGADHF